MSPTISSRNALIAKIHCARRDLGLDDVAYRQVLATATRGCRSLKIMNEGQLMAVLEHFKSKGWKAAPAKAAKAKAQLASTPMDRKIRALWITLKNVGALRDPSEKALRSYVKRMTGVEDLRFCDDGKKWLLIEVLKKWLARVEAGEPVPEYEIVTKENGGLPVTEIVEKTP